MPTKSVDNLWILLTTQTILQTYNKIVTIERALGDFYTNDKNEPLLICSGEGSESRNIHKFHSEYVENSWRMANHPHPGCG